jgi:hypothetical protein
MTDADGYQNQKRVKRIHMLATGLFLAAHGVVTMTTSC